MLLAGNIEASYTCWITFSLAKDLFLVRGSPNRLEGGLLLLLGDVVQVYLQRLLGRVAAARAAVVIRHGPAPVIDHVGALLLQRRVLVVVGVEVSGGVVAEVFVSL